MLEYPRAVDVCLAHSIKNKLQAVTEKSDLEFEKKFKVVTPNEYQELLNAKFTSSSLNDIWLNESKRFAQEILHLLKERK